MSDYRDNLVEEVEATSEAMLLGTTQIDVTSSGNYAASWMKQKERFRQLDQLDATVEMQRRMSESSDYDMTNLQVEKEGTGEDASAYGYFWNREAQQLERQQVQAIDGPEALSYGFVDDIGEFQGVEIPRSDPAYEAIRSSDQFQTARDASVESFDTWSAENLQPLPGSPEVSTPSASVPDIEPEVGNLQQLQESVDRFNAQPVSVENYAVDVSASEMPGQQSPATPAVDPPPLTRTQEDAKARGDALRARQARNTQPQAAVFPDLRGTEQKPEPEADVEPLNRTQEKAKSRGDALRARQERLQEGVEEMLETGENLPTRQPNFRADSTSYNASIHDFGVTVADNFETTANTLSIINARLRRIEQIIAEAGR